MSGRKNRELSEEDRILWDLVARSVKPAAPPKRRANTQSHTPYVEQASEEQKKPLDSTMPKLPAYRPPAQPPKPVARPHMDVQTLDKLAKGRLPLEARVDLHGMRQDEAHGLLLSFVARAHARGVRYVLVITGKGSSSGGDGVLKRSVPAWLATTPFKQYVSAHESAARGHGGAGALYVRLKRTHQR